MYKIGDKIVVLIDTPYSARLSAGDVCTIREMKGSSSIIQYVVEDSNGIEWKLHEDAFELYSVLPTGAATALRVYQEAVEKEQIFKCECGADSVHGLSGHHSSWCPKVAV